LKTKPHSPQARINSKQASGAEATSRLSNRNRSAAAQLRKRNDGDRRLSGAAAAGATPAAAGTRPEEGACRERGPPEGDWRPPQGPPEWHVHPLRRRFRPPRLRLRQVRFASPPPLAIPSFLGFPTFPTRPAPSSALVG